MNRKRDDRASRAAEKNLPHNSLARWIAVFVAAAAILVAAGIAGMRLYGEFRERRLFQVAEEMRKMERVQDAVLALQSILMRDPDNLQALSRLADLAESQGAPSYEIRSRIAEADPEVVQNHIDAARAAMIAGRIERAAHALDAVPDSTFKPVAYYNLLSAIELQNGNLENSLEAARKAAEMAPDQPNLQYNLAVLLVRQGGRDAMQEANAILLDLQQIESARPRVLKLLLSLARGAGDMDSYARLAEEVVKLPQATVAEHIPLLEVLAERERVAASDLLHALWSKSLERPTDRLILARWALANGFSDKLLTLVDSLPDARRNEDLTRIVTLDALASSEKWERILESYRDASWDNADFVRQAYLARALRETDAPESWQARWKQAVLSASENPTFLLSLYQSTRDWKGWETQQIDLLWRLIDRRIALRSALDELAKLYHQTENASGLYRVVERQFKLEPENPTYSNNYAMLNLLLEKDVETATEIAAKAHEATPADPVRISTWAFAQYRNGDPAGALATMRKLPERFLQFPSLSLYYAVILHANGKVEEAIPFAENAALGSMLDAERNLLEKAR